MGKVVKSGVKLEKVGKSGEKLKKWGKVEKVLICRFFLYFL